MRKHLPILIILLASIVVHFLYFGYPKETVFDEVHFGKFISGYFTHEYFFDIHPPLGKLIIAGAGYLAGFQPGFSFANIGEQFPDSTYLWLRLLPTLASILLPMFFYLLLIELKFSRAAALTGGLLVVFENALFVQSRFMLLDAFLLLFGFISWWLYARYRNHPHIGYIIGAAVMAGASASVKWTGLAFLAVIGFLELVAAFKDARRLWNVLILAILPFIVYFAFFSVHFSLLSKPGPGDAFMTQEFRDGKLSPLEKFIELNGEMYSANARLTATHPYSSKWYTWPFMARPIYYWNEGTAKIYLLGNPLIWWASTFGILYVLINLITTKEKLPWLITGAYAINMVPFIGIDRAMFLYHYFAGLMIAILALVYVIDAQKNRNKIFTGLVLASIVLFIFFAPLSYGLPLTEQGFNLRAWSQSWR